MTSRTRWDTPKMKHAQSEPKNSIIFKHKKRLTPNNIKLKVGGVGTLMAYEYIHKTIKEGSTMKTHQSNH